MLYAYDLDGVLVDTQQANLAAYHTINIQPPPNFHQIHWTEWCHRNHHDNKNKVLPQFKHLIKPLPLLEFALEHPGPVYTMCSMPAFDLIMEAITDMRPRTVWFVTQAERLAALIKLGGIDSTFYFDDNPEFCKIAARTTKVTVCQVYPSS